MSDKNELMTTGSGFLALADFNMNESMPANEFTGYTYGFWSVSLTANSYTIGTTGGSVTLPCKCDIFSSFATCKL